MNSILPFDVDSDKGKIDYGKVARHECGHAVVAIAKGKRIERIRLGRSFGWDTHGETKHEPQDDPRVECLISASGVVAERRFCEGVLENSAARDHDNVRWWVRKNPASFPAFGDTDEWFASLIAALELEADTVIAEHTSLFEALASRLDELITDWNWKPEPFGLSQKDIDAIITALK